MAIFSDGSSATPPATAAPTDGWQSIGSLHERKKENTITAKPWAGEILKASKRTGTTEKMTVFKDQVSISLDKLVLKILTFATTGLTDGIYIS